MQAKQADDKNVRRVGVEEEHIKFRPSPNFKNMKKFLKSRSDYSETTTLANPITTVAPSIDTTDKIEKKEVKPVVPPPHAIAAASIPAVVQPPLPPYPPPDSPPLNVTIKQEREDEDDIQNTSSGEGELSQDPQITTTEQHITEQSQLRPKKTICKEFIRGNCKRPICKYAHEVDVSQLAGVFTFCWNYQNDVCTFPNCRFVHASVFEEAEFYRTGVLPPHARSHLKKQQMPPPPPPDETRPEMSFANPPPPPLHISMEPKPEVDEFKTPLPRSISPLKREWSEIDEFNTSPREFEPIEQMVKKCKKCEINELSLKYNKEMMESMIQSSKENNKKMGLLNKKSNKLLNVLITLLKPGVFTNKVLGNGFISGGGEKEKSVLEQLNSSLLTGPNRMSSLINDDGIKNIMIGNVSLPSLMAKLLCSAGEQPLATDTSRET